MFACFADGHPSVAMEDRRGESLELLLEVPMISSKIFSDTVDIIGNAHFHFILELYNSCLL